jgi:Trk-type K+ transport system membrane component
MSLQDSRSVSPALFNDSLRDEEELSRHPFVKTILKIVYKLLNHIVAIYRGNRYRIIFAVYTFSVTWVTAVVMYVIQKETDNPITVLDAWFMSISSFSGCGLTVVDITQWKRGAQIMILVALQLGSLPICSAFPSLLRLRALWCIDCNEILPSDAKVVRRHYKVNLVVIWMSLMYWFLVQSLSVMFLVAACQMSFWWSIFHTTSGFSQGGFPLDSRGFAIPELIEKSQLLLLFIVLVPMGNALFPVWQRLHVWLWSRIARFCSRGDAGRDTTLPLGKWFLLNLSWREFSDGIDELLGCPSLYYTHLFSRKSTLSLLGMWMGLTIVDFLMFLPDYGTSAFISTDHQWLQALFQTATIRTAGMSTMDVSHVELGHLMYWVMAMYLSSYPYMLTDQGVEKTAKAKADEDEKRDLVILDPNHRIENTDADVALFDPTQLLSMLNPSNFAPTAIVDNSIALVEASRDTLQEIAEKAQATVATEIGWLYVACVAIAYTESYTLNDGGDDAPVLRLLFEVASAYGTIGLSLSSIEKPTVSYCAIFHPLAQLIIVALMYFGKFRGLPQKVSIHWVSRLVAARRAAKKARSEQSVSGLTTPRAGVLATPRHASSFRGGSDSMNTDLVQFPQEVRFNDDADNLESDTSKSQLDAPPISAPVESAGAREGYRVVADIGPLVDASPNPNDESGVPTPHAGVEGLPEVLLVPCSA